MKIAAAAASVLLAGHALAGGVSVAGSKHDLSVTGPGPIKALRESNACVFCHAFHGGGKNMLSRPDSQAAYLPYESGTMRNRPSAPTGASRVCLSCHDGTIAVGQTRSYRIEMAGTPDGRIPAGRRSNLGTDLRQSHPFSIRPDSIATRRPPGRGHVKLDDAGLVQCTSCHDPHSEFGGTPEGKFLVKGTARSELCGSCHATVMGSSHMTSSAAYAVREAGATAYATVADAGCMACHRSHNAAPKGQLLRLGTAEADQAVCVRCHAAGAGASDIARELAKPWSHAVPGAHDASEGPQNAAHRLPEASVGASRHATCVDCHNPHEARPSTLSAGARLAGSLQGVWGIDDLGRRSDVAQFEYQICFKCHGDSQNQPAAFRGAGQQPVRRAAADANLRRVFAASSPSSHPVVAPGRNPDVPSLRAPLTAASQIRCTDCHASDDGPGAGGSGPRGPHGSIHHPLLERNYSTSDLTPESPATYALCYKCHVREVLLSPASAFPLHQKHVVDQRTPCSACHAAHGVSATAGTPLANAHLVDFDLTIVRPAAGAPYTSTGPRAGSCNLTCHGQRHDSLRY